MDVVFFRVHTQNLTQTPHHLVILVGSAKYNSLLVQSTSSQLSETPSIGGFAQAEHEICIHHRAPVAKLDLYNMLHDSHFPANHLLLQGLQKPSARGSSNEDSGKWKRRSDVILPSISTTRSSTFYPAPPIPNLQLY